MPRVGRDNSGPGAEVKERWDVLTNAELAEIEGRRDQLLRRIQERYGKARDEV